MIPRRGAGPLAFPRVAARVRPRLRHLGLRPRTARVRRSSGPALPALARAHARPRAVGVESRMVDGISRDAVLPAGLLLSRPSAALGLLRHALRSRDLPGPAVADVAGSGRDRVRSAPAQ